MAPSDDRLRLHTPLIKLDRGISRIQLSDKAFLIVYHTFAHDYRGYVRWSR